MKVGFFTVFRKDPQHYVLAERLIRSVREAMPGVKIAHFTDDEDHSPAVLGVDEVRRGPHGPMLQCRLNHYAHCEGDWLLLDTDVLVQQDVRRVFDDREFDIAVCDRNWPGEASTPEFDAAMPYNTGVVFSRSPLFWKSVLAKWDSYPKEQQRDWLSEQQAFAAIVKAGGSVVRVLPGAIYNRPPIKGVDMSDAAILHFKGDRKKWMLTWGQTPVNHPPIIGNGNVPRVFIGYDPRQPVAFHVAAHSIQSRASKPVSITRLQLNQLPITRRGLTEFTYSRFLVPYLSDYQGWSVFVDADTLCLGDICDLVQAATRNVPAPVHVVQGDRRFEWASVMIFDNARCQNLTPEFVQDPRNGLLDLAWASSIGGLPKAWNVLVGYDSIRNAQLVHFTQGVPIWPETINCEYAGEWQAEAKQLLKTVSFQELMGNSVHVQHMAVAR